MAPNKGGELTLAATRTDSRRLRLTIDLGTAPTLQAFANQWSTLYDVYYNAARTAFLSEQETLATRIEQGSSPVSFRAADLEVQRTSLASPWVTVLTEAAHSSPWVGIGAAVVFGGLRALKQLLELKKDYDLHEIELERSKIENDQLRLSAAAQSVAQFDQLMFGDNIARPGSVRERLRAELTKDLGRLGPVQGVEFIGDDDERHRRDEE